MKKKRIKKKYKNILVVFVVFVLILAIMPHFNQNEEDSKEELLTDFSGMSILEVQNYGDKHEMEVIVSYQYHDSIIKDNVILSSIIDNKIDIIVSLGQIDEKVYREYNVNELGRVPIMMYHGIVDITETEYIGGNVDKDGYNRTANAFREDLEFYYQSGYRMIRLFDYVNGKIDVPLGNSPIILTFDDGNKNNFNVLGRNSDGSLQIDPNCAVGILESFKKKYPDFNVTATFFVMNGLFNQSEYNEEILRWLVDNGYDVGSHTTNHANFTEIGTNKTQEVVGKMYKKLESVLGDKYVNILALPYGSPYKKNHVNYPYILKGTYDGYSYETIAALQVGWESEVSPFNKNFDKYFLKRCRAYDNNGSEFDIEMVFKNLEKNRYISDGDIDTVVIEESMKDTLNSEIKNVITYKEEK